MSCNQNSAEDGTQSETAICLPPALTLTRCKAGEGHSARPCCTHPPWSSSVLPGVAAGAHPRRPCWSCCGHEARAPFQSTYSLNVYRLAVLAGLSTAHVFLYFLLFCFFNIFYKKKILYKQYINGFL